MNRGAGKIKTHTRKDLEKSVLEKIHGKTISSKLIVDSVIESIRELLLEADPLVRIEIRDFGVFEIKKTKPKPKARNMKTGEFIFVPGRRKIHFKPGKILKDYLKKNIDNDFVS
ncbi:MAG: HU family DNA-binding protein [Ignavibacteria bacterium]